MREIKFRGKSSDDDKWVYGAFLPDALEQIGDKRCTWGFIRYYDNLIGKMVTREVDRETIGQYTGLKNSDGVKVYEGDILEWFSPKADTDGSDLRCKVTVIWNGCGFDVDGYENGLIDFLECKGNETVKVIGNIHD